MLRPARLALLLSTLLGPGCSREPAAPAAEVTAPAAAVTALLPTAVDPWLASALASTGPRAAVLVVFYPDRWADVQRRLADFIALLPAEYAYTLPDDLRKGLPERRRLRFRAVAHGPRGGGATRGRSELFLP